MTKVRRAIMIAFHHERTVLLSCPVTPKSASFTSPVAMKERNGTMSISSDDKTKRNGVMSLPSYCVMLPSPTVTVCQTPFCFTLLCFRVLSFSRARSFLEDCSCRLLPAKHIDRIQHTHNCPSCLTLNSLCSFRQSWNHIISTLSLWLQEQ